jgi:hypothetical protein
MDMDVAAVWLGGSILTMLGFIVVVIGVVTINNILHKYWKPIRIFTEDSFTTMSTPRFLSEEDATRIAPTLDGDKNKESDSKNVDLSKNR